MPTDRDIVQLMFDFLQGKNAAGLIFDGPHPLSLTADQAWIAIHRIQELNCALSDTIERCGNCGDLYDSDSEGIYDESVSPFNFCGDPCRPEVCHAD